MKRFIGLSVIFILSVMLFESNVFGQKVGRLYKSEIQTTELDGDDIDTLSFTLSADVLDNNNSMSIWIFVDYTNGASDSISLQYRTSLLSGSLPNSQGDALVDVVLDSSFSDAVWNGYDITPIPGITEFLDILVGHAMLTGGPDSSSVQVRLLYR